ncbi:MAG: hypothetical protein ABIZ72_07105 [Candidatus Limnocylindrales bacterium]
MNPVLVAVAAITVGGGIVAVGSRDVRATLLGLLLVLLGAPLVADPWPGLLAILVRIAATLLAVRLIAISLRGDSATSGIVTSGSRIGWTADALLAAAAAVVGFGSHGLGATGLGPAEAQAAGFALVVLAVAPLVTGRDALRVAVGGLLLLIAASLIRAGLDQGPSDAEQLVAATLTIALGGAVAAIMMAARAAGGLETITAGGAIRPGLGGAGRRLPDAHRPGPRETADAGPETAGAGPEEPRARRRLPSRRPGDDS